MAIDDEHQIPIANDRPIAGEGGMRMEIRALGYVIVESPEGKQWTEFGPEVLGMAVGDPPGDGTVHLRLDDRNFRLAVRPGEQHRLSCLGWEVANASALRDLVDRLTTASVAVEQGTEEDRQDRGVLGLARFTDPAGIAHELFYGQRAVTGGFLPGRPMSGFATGDQGMGHAVIIVPDLEQALSFYTDVLGFGLSDEVHSPIGRLVFLHCNPRHHSLAVVGMPGVRGLHHVMFQVNDLDDVGTAYDLCEQRGVPIVMTLGRHSNDRMFSFYMRGPSGFEIEYGWGATSVDTATWTASLFDTPSIWGHKFVGQEPPGCIELL